MYHFHFRTWYLKMPTKNRRDLFSYLPDELRDYEASHEDCQGCLLEVGNTFRKCVNGFGWKWRKERVGRKGDSRSRLSLQ